MMGRGVFAFMLVAAFMLPGCMQAPGRIYQRPFADARNILAKTGLPPFVFGSEEPDLSMDLSDPTRVTWIIKHDGAEVLRFDALLSQATDATTRVSVEMHAPTEGASGDIAARLDANPTIRDLYRNAMEERVASALEDRDFNMAVIYPQLMQASLANLGRLRSSADAAAAASQQLERDNIARAYSEEAAGGRR